MFDVQTILVFSIVFAAAVFVGRRAWKKLRSFSGSAKSDCSTGCGNCGTETAASPKLTQIKRS